MNPRSALSRRLFLQGTGVALTLPAFESFAADKAPPRRLVCVGNHLGFYPGHFFPKDTGKAYTATSTLKPLEADRDDLTIFSNLDHGLNGGHNAVQGFLNSIKKEEAAGFPDKNISLDQAAAEQRPEQAEGEVVAESVVSRTAQETRCIIFVPEWQ